jgi:predicted transcriptional regulator
MIDRQLDDRAYRQRARMHQPADLRAAVAELARQGLRASDIARLLELSEPAVTALLQRSPIASARDSLPTVADAQRMHADAWRRSSDPDSITQEIDR